MPANGPVYQPTTVSYEQQGCEWTGPAGYLSQTISNVRRARFIQWLIVAVGGVMFFCGLTLLIIVDNYANSPDKPPEEPAGEEIKLAVGVVLMTVGAIVVLIVLIRTECRNKSLPCFPSKEQRMARQLRENQASNGQIVTLNPSTDLLMTAQYAPVSEVAYPPPAADEEETHKLMGSDNKECELGRSNSQAKGSRRFRKISLTSFRNQRSPPGRAPLAGGEEITPSLRSSFASVYYNMTPYDSSLSLDDNNGNDEDSVSSDLM